MTLLAALASVFLRVLAQVSVNVSTPVAVGARDPVLVQVEVTAPAGRDVQVLAPSFAPFRVVTSSVVSVVDSATAQLRRGGARAAWQTIEHRYVLSAPPGASGRYLFGPFEARVRAPGLREAVARSAAWSITVQAPPVPASALPAIVERARLTRGRGINFHALVVPETVYVGQQVTYQVGVFLDETVRTRLRRNPEFLPPELRGLLAYELPAGRASLRDRVIDGKRWDVHVFQRAVFPLEAGRTDVPPAQLSYSLPLSLGFFSREESYTARSEPATIVGVAPPIAGRPADWSGAVGVLRASARLDTTSGRVGDPLVLTVRVEGAGNVKLLPRPRLDIPWASAVAGEERVTIDSTSLLVRGAKEFDWIVTPRVAGGQVVPPLRYPYFDPYRRQYDVALATEVPVLVAPGALAASTPIDSGVPAPLEIRRVDAGPVGAPLASSAAFWLVALAAPLPAAVLVVRRRPPTVRKPRAPEMALRDAARKGGQADVRAIRRAFASALAERLAWRDASAAIVSARAGVLARRLRRVGVTSETAAAVEELVHRLDAAAYASRIVVAATDEALAARAVALYDGVDREARSRSALRAHAPRTARGTTGIVLLVAASAVAAAAGATRIAWAREASAFALGVEAYGTRRYADAARHFRAAASAEPRSPDAWANVGTASWAAGDTVGAAVGWQRAIRLQPRAEDVRVRLHLLPAAQDGWIAGVPPLPVDWAALTGLALWLTACGVAVVRLRGRGRGWPLLPIGAAALLGASASAVLSVQLARLAEGRGLAVVRSRGELRSEPALGTSAGAPVAPTDIARVLARQSVWARVALDGGRQGWIESERLIPLGR